MSAHENDSSQSQPVFAPKSATREAEPSAAWERSGSLLYTLAETGKYWRGEPIKANRITVRVEWDRRFATDEEGAALTLRLLQFLQNAQPSEAARNASPLGASEAKHREDHQ